MTSRLRWLKLSGKTEGNIAMAHLIHKHIGLKGPIETKVVCFSRLLKWLRSLYGKQFGPRSTLFASILNSSVMLGNYLQQTTSADDFSRQHFQMHFFLGALRVDVIKPVFGVSDKARLKPISLATDTS